MILIEVVPLAATEIEVDYFGVARGHCDEFPVRQKTLSQLNDSAAMESFREAEKMLSKCLLARSFWALGRPEPASQGR